MKIKLRWIHPGLILKDIENKDLSPEVYGSECQGRLNSPLTTAFKAKRVGLNQNRAILHY